MPHRCSKMTQDILCLNNIFPFACERSGVTFYFLFCWSASDVFFCYYSMITEQIHQLSGCVDAKCEYVGVSAMKMFNEPLTLATLGNTDVSNAGQATHSRQASSHDDESPCMCLINHAVRVNKTSMEALEGSQPAAEMTSEVKSYASHSRWLMLSERVEIRYSFFLLFNLWYGGKLLPAAAAAQLPCDSYDVTWFGDLILSISQSQAATSGRISTAVTVK